MTSLALRHAALEPYQAYCGRPLKAVFADLEKFCAVLEKWQRMQNLVSRETLADVWDRHIIDSLQLLPIINGHLHEKAPATIVDIGSGGGFPALPLAIALKELPVRLYLIESRSRKCAFLKAVVREFALPATVITARIEDVDVSRFAPVQAITARALAPLPLLFSYLEHFWEEGETRAYLHKGREYGEELAQTDSVWRAAVLNHPSTVDPQGVILEVSSLTRIA